jgi:hypothetical protein
MLCDFHLDSDGTAICSACGKRVVFSTSLDKLRSRCLSGYSPRRVAVGDLVERMLTGVGISKERVQQWLRVKDCGCAKRQKWLNQWGYKQQDRIERLLNKAARWYGIG